MMEKVKLTRERAEAIEKLLKSRTKESIAREKANPFTLISGYIDKSSRLVFKDMEFDTLIKALYIGYEVEQEFKVGDWLVHWEGEENVIRQAVSNVKDDFIDVEDEEGDTYIWNVKHIRQATLEEIAEEKQRRWWAKHGRKVKEV